MADRLSGKASYIIFNSATLAITKYTPKVSRKLADQTDSGDYNSTQDMIFPTQVPVSAPVELSIEGRFRKSQTPAIMSLLNTSTTNIPVTLGLDAGTLWGHGNFDISDFDTDVVYDDVVTYTCTIKSNGAWTPNA